MVAALKDLVSASRNFARSKKVTLSSSRPFQTAIASGREPWRHGGALWAVNLTGTMLDGKGVA